VLRNLGTGVIVAAAAIVRTVICNGGGRRVEFSHGWAEIVPHPLRDRLGYGAAKHGGWHYTNERAVRHHDSFKPHDVGRPALTRPIDTRLMRKSCNLREAQCAVRWPCFGIV
jgi:hypothetical protein